MSKPTQSIFPIENGKLLNNLDANNLQIENLDTSNLVIGGGSGIDTGTTTAILKGDGNHGIADAVADIDYASADSVMGKEDAIDHDADVATLTTGLAATNTAVALKADSAATTTAINLKADDADLQAYITSNDIAVGANTTDIATLSTDLGNKADSASVSAALAGKEPTLPTTANDSYILARRNASGTNAWFFVDPVTLGTTSQSFTDGVENSSTTFTSATANFVTGDVGKTITGDDIPAATTIASRTNSTTIVLSQAATATGTGKNFTIINRLEVGGTGTVTSVSLTNNVTSLFTGQVNNPTSSPEIVLTALNTVGAFNFYANDSNATGFAHFIDRATARTTLGGTTVGQALFQLANPSAISYPRINADNTVTARTPAQTLGDLGAESVLTFTSPLARATNTVSIPAATDAVPGHLTAADHALFNAKVPTTRLISTTAPLVGGGDLSVNRTHSIPAATGTVDGYLPATDFANFTAKPPNTRTISTTAPLTGGGDLSANRTLAIPAATLLTDGYLRSTDYINFVSAAPVIILAGQGTPAGTLTLNPAAFPPVNRIVLNSILTQVLTITLPPASVYNNSLGLDIVDVTTGAMVNFGVIITRAASTSDTIDGQVSISLARGSSYLRLNSNGVAKWTSTTYTATSFSDPVTPNKKVFVDVSGQGVGANRVWHPATAGDSGSAINFNNPKVGTGSYITSYDSASGLFSADPVHVYDLLLTQYDITNASIASNAASVSPDDGTVDNVKLSASLAAPLALTWPRAGLYNSGEAVRFYDPKGSISSTNTVTVTNGFDTFNVAGAAGGSSIVITEPGAVRTAFAEPSTNTWTFSPFSGANNGTTVAYSGLLPENTSTHKLTWTVVTGVNRQVAYAIPTANDELVIAGALQSGMRFELAFIQDGTGGRTLTLPFGSRTPSNGLGVIPVTSTANAVTKITGTYYGVVGGISYLWESQLDYTAAVVAACSTLDVTNGTGTGTQSFGNGTGSVYQATRFTPGANYNLCRVDVGLFYSGSSFGGQTATVELRSDVAGVPATSSIATSTPVASTVFEGLTTAVAAVASPTRFDFVTPPAVTNGTSYWIVVHMSSFNSVNHPNWAVQSAGTVHAFRAPEPGTAWTDQGSNSKLYFKSFHS